jgi:hypothetical protein
MRQQRPETQNARGNCRRALFLIMDKLITPARQVVKHSAQEKTNPLAHQAFL